MRRIALFAAFSLLALTTATAPARASGLVLGERSVGPVSLRVAASSDGTSTTRWQSMVVPAGQRVAWLVPVRPGARVDLAGEALLAALDETTAVRVARPGGGVACGRQGDLETHEASVPNERSQRDSDEAMVLSSEAALRQFATNQGFVLPNGAGTRAFRDGFQLLALTFESRARPTTTPVVRVTDDGPLSLPLVLADTLATDVELTTFVIADGAVQVGSRASLPWGTVAWGPAGSTYRDDRTKLLVSHRGFGFLTEAAGHDLVFGPRPLLPDGTSPPSLVTSYASRVARTPSDATSCASALARMTNHPVRFGTLCPAGALAAVAPETDCVATSGGSDVTTATCGTTEDDLAIALSGKRIDRIAVTRAAGIVPAGSIGSYVAIGAGEEKEPLVTAKLSEACLPPSQLEEPSPPRRTGGNGGPVATAEEPGPTYVYDNGGCSGGGAVYIDTSSTSNGGGGTTSDDSCSSSDSSSSTDDGGGCGGDTVGGDNDGSSDACSSSSSDSSDSCDSGSGDSCDSPDASNRKQKHGKSPMSRAAFVIVALALPLRRLFRKRDDAPSDDDGGRERDFRA